MRRLQARGENGSALIWVRILDILKMSAIFQLNWVRRLNGKPGVPYNRGLRVQGSPHPTRLWQRFTGTGSGQQRFPRPIALGRAGGLHGALYQLYDKARDRHKL